MENAVIEACARLARGLSVVFEQFADEMERASGMFQTKRDPRIPADISQAVLEMDPHAFLLATPHARCVWDKNLNTYCVRSIEQLIRELLDERVRSWPGVGNTTLAEVQGQLTKLGISFIPAKCFKKR